VGYLPSCASTNRLYNCWYKKHRVPPNHVAAIVVRLQQISNGICSSYQLSLYIYPLMQKDSFRDILVRRSRSSEQGEQGRSLYCWWDEWFVPAGRVSSVRDNVSIKLAGTRSIAFARGMGHIDVSICESTRQYKRNHTWLRRQWDRHDQLIHEKSGRCLAAGSLSAEYGWSALRI
jgi:hypothetical protein